LEKYLPSLNYLLLDEGAFDLKELTPLKNLVAAVFRLENSTTREDIIEVISNLIEWLATPEQTRLRRSFSVWINRVLQEPGDSGQSMTNINDLVEIKTMLAQRIPTWIQEGELRGEARGKAIGEAQGEIKGEIKGEAKTLLKLLNLKFGAVPDWAEQKINAADKDQLDLWVERVLAVDSLDNLFG